MATIAAERANQNGNPPFGCVIAEFDADSERPIVHVVSENKVVTNGDVTAHAEILALREIGLRNTEAKGGDVVDLGRCAIFTNVASCPGCASFCLKAGLRSYYYAGRAEETAQPDMPVEVLATTMRGLVRARYIDLDGFAGRQVAVARQGGFSVPSIGQSFPLSRG